MILTGYIISFFIGRLTVDACLKKEALTLPSFLLSIIALGIGLGISAFLVLIDFLILGQFHKGLIIGLNVAALLILFFLNRNSYKENDRALIKHWFPAPPFRAHLLLITAFWAAALGLLYFAASQHPYGEWDAWAIWNLKAKFLIYADSWKPIFHDLHVHTHPDYPLLLPMMHVWVYCFSQGELYPIPMITALIFALGCGLLLYNALIRFTGPFAAFLAGILLVISPIYLHLSTFQYADILIAFYLLAALHLISLMQDKQSKGLAILSGCILGILTFIKNDGSMMAMIILALSVLFISTDKKLRKPDRLGLIQHLFLAFVPFALATGVFKLFVAPPNDDILPSFSLGHIDMTRLEMILKAVLNEITDKKWCHIWVFVILLLVTGLPKLFRRENIILTIFFTAYITLVFLIYLFSVKANLSWWLETSLSRIFFYLLPALLYLGFRIHWQNKNNMGAGQP